MRLTNPKTIAAMKRAVSAAMGEHFVVLDLLEQNKEIFKAFETEEAIPVHRHRAHRRRRVAQ